MRTLLDDHESGKRPLDDKNVARYKKLLKRFDAIENFGLAEGTTAKTNTIDAANTADTGDDEAKDYTRKRRTNASGPRYVRPQKGEKHPRQKGSSLVEEFRERRVNLIEREKKAEADNAATDENPFAGAGVSTAGAPALRSTSPALPSTSPALRSNRPFRTGRLNKSEMEARAEKMKRELKLNREGGGNEAPLDVKTVRRYKAFIRRYEDLQNELTLMDTDTVDGGGESKDGGGGENKDGDGDENKDGSGKKEIKAPRASSTIDPPTADASATSRSTANTKTFKKGKGMIKELLVGPTEKREAKAQGIRKQLADHESGTIVLEEVVYTRYKTALGRYDKRLQLKADKESGGSGAAGGGVTKDGSTGSVDKFTAPRAEKDANPSKVAAEKDGNVSSKAVAEEKNRDLSTVTAPNANKDTKQPDVVYEDGVKHKSIAEAFGELTPAAATEEVGGE